MAEGILRARLGSLFHVASAGVGAVVGYPATEEAALTAAARGADISAHRAQQLDAALAADSDLLVVMEERHRAWVSRFVTSAVDKTYLLGHWRQAEIPDPVGRPLGYYDRVAALIEACVDDWVERLVT